MRGRRGALVAVLALHVLVASPAASASCAAPSDPVRLADHELVFAGEVDDVGNDGRVAEVRVLDVWRGRDLPPDVVVFGGPTDDDSTTSVDRFFVSGTTYAFFAYEDEDGVLRDNACTATARLSERAALDPPGTRAPVDDAPAPADPRGPGWPWLLAAVAAVCTGTAAVAHAARTRRARSN